MNRRRSVLIALAVLLVALFFYLGPGLGLPLYFVFCASLVAISFIVFDLETVFLFPWAVIYKQSALFFFLEMVVFLAILLVGYLYAWRRGALEWA